MRSRRVGGQIVSDGAIIQAPVADAGRADFASGWHAYLDILDDRLHGRKPRAFWTNFDRLQKEYAKRF